MTCIVGIKTDKEIWIGGDAAGSNYAIIDRRSIPKVFRVKHGSLEMIMGYTTSFRMGQLLQYKLRLPDFDPRISVEKYLVVDFVDEVRKIFKEGGFSGVANNVESGGSFIVGFKNKLFTIEGDYQVSETTLNYASVGSGSYVALGSLYSNEHISSPKDRLENALNAAVEHTPYVRTPFTYEKLDIET